MKRLLIAGMLVSMVIAKDKPTPESKPTEINIPNKFGTEIQALAQQYSSLSVQQKIADLTRDNLMLRICAEVEIKPAECRVDWNGGKVSKIEIAKPTEK